MLNDGDNANSDIKRSAILKFKMAENDNDSECLPSFFLIT